MSPKCLPTHKGPQLQPQHGRCVVSRLTKPLRLCPRKPWLPVAVPSPHPCPCSHKAAGTQGLGSTRKTTQLTTPNAFGVNFPAPTTTQTGLTSQDRAAPATSVAPALLSTCQLLVGHLSPAQNLHLSHPQPNAAKPKGPPGCVSRPRPSPSTQG